MRKAYILITALLAGIVAAVMGILIQPVHFQPTLTWGYVFIAISFLLLFGFSVFTIRVNNDNTIMEMSVRAQYIVCLVHVLVQIAAVYILCALRIKALKAVTIQGIMLAVLVVVLVLMHFSAQDTALQSNKVKNSFVNRALDELRVVRCSDIGSDEEDICLQIEKALRGSPHLSNHKAELIEEQTIEVLQEAAKNTDSEDCIAALKNALHLIRKRNSVI